MRGLAVLFLGTALVLTPNVRAQASVQAEASTQFDVAASIADMRRLLQQNYVLPEMRPKLDAALAKGLASGRYNVSDPGDFVERVNADMAAVAHDKHLSLSFNPEGAARLAASPPPGGGEDGPAPAEAIRSAERANHGLVELKVLPGNIRYMEVNGFQWAGPASAAAYDNAMRFLKSGDAVIIDLRRNGGGSPAAVQYLVSHFMQANRPLMTFYMGADGTDRTSTLATLPAGRLTGKPLYVLTSGNSASAAEEFAGHVHGFKLGELVGETTAGAGFRNQFFPVAGKFLFSISVGRAVLASTGKDWEGVGIPTTIQAPVDRALEVAQAHALRKLAAKATGRDKTQLEAQAAVLDAKVNPIKTALPLSAYAGTFGERSIRLVDGKVVWQRRGGPSIGLVAVGPNEFAFEQDPLTRVKFDVAGDRASGFALVRADGSGLTATRTN